MHAPIGRRVTRYAHHYGGPNAFLQAQIHTLVEMKPPPIAVKVASPQEIHTPPYERLRECVRTVLHGEGYAEGKISLACVDNPTIHRINKQFLQHDEPTDVITFPFTGPKAKKLEGELVLGVEVAIENAKDRGHETDEELCLYVIHGCLHLCGYDDRNPKDTREMRKKEAYYLKQLKLPAISDEVE
jgi:probable rRNA maturation factor